MKGMMGKLATVVAALALAMGGNGATADPLRVLTDRTDSGTMRPIFDAFEKETGTKIEAVFIDQGLLARLTSRPTEADVVITTDAELLEIARQRGLLAPLPAVALQGIPAEFLGADAMYFVDAYRARAIITSKARVPATAIATYEDLAKPEWKGRLCVRSGLHDYNVALFDQFVASWGAAKARTVIAGIAANLARPPKGNDREQANAIQQGICDVALLNTYYYPKMLANPEQKAWAEAVRLIFPDQNGKGTFIMRSAVGITKAMGNRALAEKLAAYMATPAVQTLIVDKTQQYSVLPSVAAHPSMVEAAGAQGIKDGRFKIDLVSLANMAASREEAIRIVNEVGFDNGPRK